MTLRGGFLAGAVILLTGTGIAQRASAQFRGLGFNPQPVVTGSFGSVVFPGGTAATPGVHRTFPNAVFPGGGGPTLSVPLSSKDPTRLSGTFGNPNRAIGVGNGFVGGFNGFNGGFGRRRGTTILPYPYPVPVYVGGYGAGYDSGYGGYPPDQGAPAQAAPQQPNVIVVYPPAQQSAVIGPPPDSAFAAPPAPAPAQSDVGAPAEPAEPSHYLIAFKDHTIYSAVAYWVEGDTLHYFTNGSTHNQVSLSLVDKDLTERLNREAGITMQLPK